MYVLYLFTYERTFCILGCNGFSLCRRQMEILIKRIESYTGCQLHPKTSVTNVCVCAVQRNTRQVEDGQHEEMQVQMPFKCQ